MITTILVALDGSEASEQVLPLAASLGRGLHSQVRLLHVVDTGGPPATFKWDGQEHPDMFLRQQERQAQDYLGQLPALFEPHAVPVTCEVTAGPPAEAIIATAEASGAGLIAMTTHGRSGLARWVLGSVADRVVRTASVPVLLFHPRSVAPVVAEEQELRSVILPLDGSQAADAATALAVELAQGLGLNLLLARVVPAYPFAMGAMPAVYPELHAQMTTEATEYVKAATERIRTQVVSVEGQTLTGDPATSLASLAGQTPGGLIVMSTQGLSGLERVVLGSVTDKLVRSGVAPVIVVPPLALPHRKTAEPQTAHV